MRSRSGSEGVLRVVAHDAEVEGGEDLDGGEGAAGMAGVGRRGHLDDVAADAARDGCEFFVGDGLGSGPSALLRRGAFAAIIANGATVRSKQVTDAIGSQRNGADRMRTIARVIIDFHTHIFPPDVREQRDEYVAREPTFAEMYADPKAKIATAEDLLASMDEAGVDVSVALGFAWREHETMRPAQRLFAGVGGEERRADRAVLHREHGGG